MTSSTYRLFQNSVIYSIGNIVQKGEHIFLALIVSRFLVAEDFGRLMIINLLASFFSMTILSSMSGAIMRFYVDLEDANRKMFIGSSMMFLNGLTWIGIFIVSYFNDDFIALIFPNSGLSFFPYYLIGLAAMALNMPYAVFNSVCRIKEKPSRILYIQLLNFSLKITFITYFLCFIDEGLIGVLKGQFFAAAMMCFVYFYVLRKEMSFKFSWRLLKPAFAFSLPLAPYVLFSFVRGSSDRFFLEKYLSMKEVGIYSMGLLLGNSIGVFVSGLAASYSPRILNLIKEEGVEQAKQGIPSMANAVFFIMFMSFMGVSLFSKEILNYFVSDGYQECYVVIPFAAFAFFLRGVYLFYHNSFYWTKKTYYISVTSFWSCLVAIVCLKIFIPNMGILGAGISIVIGEVIAVILAFYWGQKAFSIEYKFYPLLFPMLLGIASVFVFVYATSLPLGFWLLQIKLLCILVVVLTSFFSRLIDFNQILVFIRSR